MPLGKKPGKAAKCIDPRARRPAVIVQPKCRRRGGQEVSMSTLIKQAPVAASSQRLLAILTAATFGVALVFISGFASPETLHNAAHDWRHSHNFPCH